MSGASTSASAVSPATGLVTSGASAAADAPQRLQQEMRDSVTRRHVQATHSIFFFIVVDALLLYGYALAGELSLLTGTLFVATGAGIVGGYRLAIWRGWHHVSSGIPIAIVTTLAVACMLLGTAFFAPKVGVLVLMTLVTVIAMTALSVPFQYTLVMCAAMGLASAGLMLRHGAALSLPMHTPVDRALSALWFTLVLLRGAMLNLRGIELRRALARKSVELADALQRLEHLAAHDELTGLHNRRAAMQRLDSQAEGAEYSVAIFDIDRFKQINDTLGHGTGDVVLKRFAQAVQAAVRDTDFFARYGGEEFLLIMPGQHDQAGALQVADRLRALAQTLDWRDIDPALAVTVSAGVAQSRRGETLEQLLARADDALYAAKRDGRNRVSAA